MTPADASRMVGACVERALKTARWIRPAKEVHVLPGTWEVWRRGVLVLLWLALGGAVSRAQTESSRLGDRHPFVLTLHSYTPSDWDNGLQRGINLELLEPARVDLYVDYMDARKVETPEYLDMLLKLLAVKYGRIKFDLVVVCDDNAYQFAMHHRSQLWPGVPVVFCGVNGFRAAEFARLLPSGFTGISENNELTDFVAAFPRIVPQLKTLLVVNDDSHYAKETLPHLLESVRRTLPGIEVKSLTNDLSAEELATRLEQAPPDSAVFFLSFWREMGGRLVNGNEAQRILSHSAVPVFTTHQGLIGHGAIGASYVDAVDQGTAAGRIARRILQGESAASIPAAIGPPRRIVFDHVSLERFRISPGALPAGAEIVNAPASFYRQYRGLVWATVSTITVLSLLVILLVLVVLQRRRAVERLSESEGKFNAFMAALPGFAFIKDQAGRMVFMNAAMRRALGLGEAGPTEREGEPLPPTDALAIQADDERLRQTMQPFVAEQNADLGGKKRTYLTSKFPILRAGRPPLFGGVAMDITERKEIEAALHDSQHFSQNVLDTTPDLVYVYALDLRRNIYANRQIADLLGYSPEEIAAMGEELFVRLLHPDDAARVAEHHGRVAAATGPVELEYRMRDRQGRWRWLRSRDKVFARDAQGAAIQIIGSASDVTERKEAEREREELRTQLNQIQKMESVGRLAGGVAHDFNNMLTAIQINATTARDALPADSPLAENLNEILHCTSRSAELTKRLLAFARKQTVAPTVLDLNATVEGMLKMLRRLIGEDIGLLWRPAPDLWLVKIDPGQIDQILANLCVNARDAIGGVGRLEIETRNVTLDRAYCAAHPEVTPGDYVLLSVSDNGCGMSKEVMDRLFEPFFTTKEVGKGTGLGLATVYGIVKQNGGCLEVQSAPGSGTTFKIHLLRHGAGTELPAKTEAVKPAGGGRETILLVEDEPSILLIGRRTLSSLGYTVLPASTPADAIRIAETHQGEIHLLATDVVMPDMNGRELARQILTLHPRLKLIFMSGYTSDIIGRQGVLEEGTHFIQKPFSIQELAAGVRSALDEA